MPELHIDTESVDQAVGLLLVLQMIYNNDEVREALRKNDLLGSVEDALEGDLVLTFTND